MLETILGAVLSGPLTGIIGGVAQLYFQHLAAKTEIEKIAAESQARIAEYSAKQAIAKTEAEGREAVAQTEALAKSHEADARSSLEYAAAPSEGWFSDIVKAFIYFLLGLVEFVKKVVRPGLAIYLCYIVTQMYLTFQNNWNQFGFTMQMQLSADMFGQIIATFLYLFTTCVSWYFVTRHGLKAPEIKIGK